MTLQVAITRLEVNGTNSTTGTLDAILAALNANGLSGGSINISANAGAPTGGAANTDKVALEGRGWTVTI